MSAIDLVLPVAEPLFACMPLECPKGGDYEPMGICTLMINIGIGSLAPMLPVIDLFTGLPGSIADIPPDLMALPFAGLTVPPLPIPAPFNLSIGSLDMPSWPGVDLPGLPPLLDLLFGMITIPFKIIEGIIAFSPPELPLLDFVLGKVLLVLQLPGVELPMLPTLGLLQLGLCILMLLLLPFVMFAEALGGMLEKHEEGHEKEGEVIMDPLESTKNAGIFAAAPLLVALLPLINFPAELEGMFDEDGLPTDKLKKKMDDAYAGALKTYEEEKAAEARAAREDADPDGDQGDSEWKPSIKDYYYG